MLNQHCRYRPDGLIANKPQRSICYLNWFSINITSKNQRNLLNYYEKFEDCSTIEEERIEIRGS